jgi:hypothetical protein
VQRPSRFSRFLRFSRFRILAFRHFRAFRVFAHITHITLFAHFAFSRISHFRAFRIFAHFAFSRISRFRVFHISHISRLSRISHLAQFVFQIPHVFAHLTNYAHLMSPHSSQFVHSRIPRISHFRAFCVFRILAFFALRHALPRASLGSIAFRSHVLSSSSKVHWCISHFVSLAFHHICLCIPLYVHLSY